MKNGGKKAHYGVYVAKCLILIFYFEIWWLNALDIKCYVLHLEHQEKGPKQGTQEKYILTLEY